MSWIITLFLMVHVNAWAQESVEDTPQDPVAPLQGFEAEDVDALFHEEWARRSMWMDQAAPVVDIAISSEDPRVAVVIRQDGGVMMTRSAGATWEMVMAPLDGYAPGQTNDEEALLGVEARVQELLDAAEVRDFEEFEEEFETYTEGQLMEEMSREASEVLDQAFDEVQADLESDPDFVVGQSQTAEAVFNVWILNGTDVFVSRPDGLWLSTTSGRRWSQVLEEPVYTVAQSDSGIWMAGTNDGVRIALRPNEWLDLEDQTEGQIITQILPVPGGVLAGGPDGLLYSKDGQSWADRGRSLGAIRVIYPDPNVENQFWVVSESGLVVTDGEARIFQPSVPLTIPMENIDTVIVLDVGRILMGGTEGVIETRDGGVTWQLFNKGLSRPRGAQLFSWGPEGIHALANGSIFRLGPAEVPEGSLTRISEWISLDLLAQGGVRRVGLEAAPELRKKRWGASMVPTLRIDGWYRYGGDLAWNRFTGTRYRADNEVLGLVSLYWTPRNRTRSGFGVIQGLSTGSGRRGTPLIVSGWDDGAAGIRINQQLASYRTSLTERIIGLYRSRQEMVLEREQMKEVGLLEQVIQELMIEHVEADLDFLSGRAVSRWRIK